jgi:4-hydroxybenzoate polyprenyltransferase
MIRELVLLGGAVYIIIALVQGIQNLAVQVEAVLIAGILVALSLIHYARDEERLKKIEMAGLWLAIALFVGYALAKAGGYL